MGNTMDSAQLSPGGKEDVLIKEDLLKSLSAIFNL